MGPGRAVGADVVAGIPVVAAALFGSRARGDHRPGSDVDVLLWMDGSYPRHMRRGRHALAFYPEADLLRKAAAGDLFAAHLVMEARPLRDPAGRLEALRRRYAPPASYRPQIAAASDLAFFLLSCSASIPAGLLAARAAWCARTIAIARLAETGRLVFATDVLANGLGSPDLRRLVERRGSAEWSARTAWRLERFVGVHGVPPGLPGAAMIRDHASHFAATGNDFALKTVRQLRLRQEDGSYV